MEKPNQHNHRPVNEMEEIAEDFQQRFFERTYGKPSRTEYNLDKGLPVATMDPEIAKLKATALELATEILPHPSERAAWLGTPKRVSLNGRAPAEMLNSVDGCQQVIALLRELYS